MENYGIKINVVTFIIMFCFASEITNSIKKNSKKRLLSVAIKSLLKEMFYLHDT